MYMKNTCIEQACTARQGLGGHVAGKNTHIRDAGLLSL